MNRSTVLAVSIALGAVALAAPAGATHNPWDTAFGGDGQVTTDFGSNDEADDVVVQLSDDVPAAAMALAADGKIVVVGRSGGSSASSEGDFVVSRFVGHTPLQATLTVVNEVVNDDGGTAVASDWTISVSGVNPVPAVFPGAPAPGTTVTLDPGTYSVSAGGPSGYLTTLAPDCDGAVAAGDTRTCTVTHDDHAPGPCVLLSETAVSVSGTASTPSARRTFGTDPPVAVRNCGTTPVNLQARGTDASGPGAVWQLTDMSSGGPIDSVCELGTNLFRTEVSLPASGGGGVGIWLSAVDRLLLDPEDGGLTPFVLAPTASHGVGIAVEMPCAGSAGIGQQLSMDVTLTAVAP